MKIVTGRAGSGKTRELCHLIALESNNGTDVTVIFSGKTREYYMELLLKEKAALDKIHLVDLQAQPAQFFNLLKDTDPSSTVFLDVETLSATHLRQLEEVATEKALNLTVTVQTNKIPTTN